MTLARVRMTDCRWLTAAALLVARPALAQTPSDAAPKPTATADPAAPQPSSATELLGEAAGGLTGEVVGRRAEASSFTVKQHDEALRAAAARVDESWQAFLPKLRASGSLYLVDISNPPSFGTLVVDKAGPGPIPAGPIAANTLTAFPLALPTTLGAYTLQATISVPISDYFLRIGQTHASTTAARDAAQYDLASD